MRLPRLIKRHEFWPAYALDWAPYIAVYQIVGRFPLRTPVELHLTSLDRAIPFWPELLPVYVGYLVYYWWTVARSEDDVQANRIWYATHLELLISLRSFDHRLDATGQAALRCRRCSRLRRLRRGFLPPAPRHHQRLSASPPSAPTSSALGGWHTRNMFRSSGEIACQMEGMWRIDPSASGGAPPSPGTLVGNKREVPALLVRRLAHIDLKPFALAAVWLGALLGLAPAPALSATTCASLCGTSDPCTIGSTVTIDPSEPGKRC